MSDTDLSMTPQRILVIQTAFLGDAILATSLLESLHSRYPQAQLDFLVRKGHEGLFNNHPFIHLVLTWNKKKNRYRGLWELLLTIRSRRYDQVITLQRFASTGFLTAFSGAGERIGFDKNPLSWKFSRKVKHVLKEGTHEIQRNQALIENQASGIAPQPRLYPTEADHASVLPYQKGPYICVAPASVWFTKQYPEDKWVDLINKLPAEYAIHIIGSPDDRALGERLLKRSSRKGVNNLCGKLSFLQSAALMKGATMNYVNDSAPMHIASAMNAPVCSIYCSTVPAFGFGPLSDHSYMVETTEPLTCRPCGLHGFKQCPKGHFNCARGIQTGQLLEVLN